MNLKDIKRELKLTDADIGKMFGYKNYASYYNSARRKHVENGIMQFYRLILSKDKSNKIQ